MDERGVRDAFRAAFDGVRPSAGAVDRAFASVAADEAAAAYGPGRRLAGAAAVALALLVVGTLLIARGALVTRQAAVPAARPVATPTAPPAPVPSPVAGAAVRVNGAAPSVVAAFNDQVVLVGWTSIGQLQLTNDGGATWQTLRLPAGAPLDLQWLNGDTALASTDAGLYAYQRSTSGWTRLSSRADLVRLDFTDSTSGFAVTASGDVLETEDGAATFATLNVGIHPVTWLQWVSASRAWAAGPGGIVSTRDGGATWVRQLTLPTRTGEPGAVVRAQVGFRDEANGFAVFDFVEGTRSGFVVYHTADAGATWTAEGCTCAFAAPPDWLTMNAAASLPAAPLHSDLVVSGPSSATLVSSDAKSPAARICATTDSGRDWTCTPVPYQSAGSSALAVRGRSMWLSGYGASSGALLAYSPDGGVSWTVRRP